MSQNIYNEDPFHPSNSQVRSSYCQTDYGDHAIRGSWLYSPQTSSMFDQIVTHELPRADPTESSLSLRNDGATFSDYLEDNSSRVPMTDETVWNTDHANYESVEHSRRTCEDREMTVHCPSGDIAEHQSSYTYDAQRDPVFSGEERSNVSLALLGSQFGTAVSEHIDHAVEHGSFALPHLESTPGTIADLPIYEYQRPSIVVTDHVGRNTLPVADDLHRSLIADDSVTSVKHVEQVYELVQALNRSWTQRLTPGLDLHAPCLSLSVQWLFVKGIRTLQRCYHGVLPTTFNDVFALMHIAFAFSQAIQKDGASCYWDGFSRDVYNWQFAISDGVESNLFLRAWRRLWRPQWPTPTMAPQFHPLDVTSATYTAMRKTEMEVPYMRRSASKLGVSNNNIHQPFIDQNQDDLLRMLMGGMVIEGCARFLDAIEYAAIVEGNVQKPPQRPCEEALTILLNSVTRPLEQCGAVKMIPEHISTINSKLRDGRLRNVRQLEVALISCPEWSRVPSQIHSAYLDEVASQCDKAVDYPSPSWRNYYYSADLKFVMDLFSNLEQQRHTSSTSPPQARPVRTASLDFPWDNSFGSPLSHFDDPPPGELLAPLPPVGFGASEYSNHPGEKLLNTSLTTLQDLTTFDTVSGSVTSSDFLSDDSLPSTQPVSEPSSQTTVGITMCSRCSQIFEGTPVNQRRNLRRHMHSNHGVHPRLSCSVPQCSTTFTPGRYDNLSRHMTLQHGQVTARKRKSSETA